LTDTLQVHELRDHIITFLIKVYEDNENTFWEPLTKSDTVFTCTLVMFEAYIRLELLLTSCNICHLIVHLHVVWVVTPIAPLMFVIFMLDLSTTVLFWFIKTWSSMRRRILKMHQQSVATIFTTQCAHSKQRILSRQSRTNDRVKEEVLRSEVAVVLWS
jgi:hypothetical protein